MSDIKNCENLPYNPEDHKRELAKFYISASDEDISSMLKEVGMSSMEDLFKHIPSDVLFNGDIKLDAPLEYGDLVKKMETIASKNILKTSFLGDGVAQFKIPDLVGYVCNIRGLTTAYTPYQPERSQGTLQTLWIYSSTISMLTGFEAINASFYDRATCLYEALNTATRIMRNKKTVLVADSIYPGDKEVLNTLALEADINVVYVPYNSKNGLLDIAKLNLLIEQHKDQLAGFAFPQINSLGHLEDVNLLTDITIENGIQSIAIIDPMLLATKGLLSPSDYGSSKTGVNMIVGEGQQITLDANFGGPGLGIFGIRYNDKTKSQIRSTAGRYIGKAVDSHGKDALCMVLSTREQHIRREKATSNICSNQSFVASIAGAAILARGEEGMINAHITSRNHAIKLATQFISFEGVQLFSQESVFYNEFTLKFENEFNLEALIEKASKADIHIGVNITGRIDGIKNPLLKVSCFDSQTDEDIKNLISFLNINLNSSKDAATIAQIEDQLLRSDSVNLPSFSVSELEEYYTALGEQNISPDDFLYPLGSCTMKYNPYINDYAASLEGFTKTHPQAPESDCQGNLQILFEIEEMFKGITGLPGLTTQPVAGAQGELVGLKMFQAYHRDNGNADLKDVLIIPRSAHGTNPATATMAGYKKLVILSADADGQMDMAELKTLISEYGTRIAGVMVTNPNTSGIFETNFKEMAKMIHDVDGLVYMDGANMNAIAGIVNLDELGVDAVHNNLHKTWTIPHGGGGPGDAIVAVSSKLLDYLPGQSIIKSDDGIYSFKTPSKTVGSFHRHYGNFAHKVRCYTYIAALGSEGVKKMSGVAVLSAIYLQKKLEGDFPILPYGTDKINRMHEFILTLSEDSFKHIAEAGIPKAQIIAKIGKLFLDFGMHAPTVAFPEVLGLMIEPTESFTKAELDRFVDVVRAVKILIHESPEVLKTTPHFTPVSKVDEVSANKKLILKETITSLPKILTNKIHPDTLGNMEISKICEKILDAHKNSLH